MQCKVCLAFFGAVRQHKDISILSVDLVSECGYMKQADISAVSAHIFSFPLFTLTDRHTDEIFSDILVFIRHCRVFYYAFVRHSLALRNAEYSFYVGADISYREILCVQHKKYIVNVI